MTFKKYPKLRRPGHPEASGLYRDPSDELVITEKFDGNNFRATLDWDEQALRFGSRNVDLGTDLDEIGGMFEDVAEYLDESIDPTELRTYIETIRPTNSDSAENIVLFGENAVEHTIGDYQWDEVPQFQLFDVWVVTGEGDGYWRDWSGVTATANYLGLETPPVHQTTTVGAFDPDGFDVPSSVYRPDDGVAEGVVIRNTESGTKAKVISDEFAEKMEQAKSGSARDDDVGEFVDRYVTEQRVEKQARKLIESPEYDYQSFQMEMMPDLGPAVLNDVWSENWHEIAQESWTLDLAEARSALSSRTASILRSLVRSQSVDVAKVDPGSGEVMGE